MSDRDRELDEPSLRELMKKLGNDSRLLVRQEMELARSELSHELARMKRGLVAVAVAAALFNGGLLLVLFGLVLALGLIVPVWLSLVIIAAAACALGAALLLRQRPLFDEARRAGTSALSHLHDDIDAMRGAMP